MKKNIFFVVAIVLAVAIFLVTSYDLRVLSYQTTYSGDINIMTDTEVYSIISEFDTTEELQSWEESLTYPQRLRVQKILEMYEISQEITDAAESADFSEELVVED